MSLHSLPLFVRLVGRPVILIGEGEAAEAKRRLLERAGAVVVGEGGKTYSRADPQSVEGSGETRFAIVVDDDDAVARLKARGVLVNAVDRPELCDFTLPAIIDRDPVIVAIGTGGASAGLAAALRQRFEALLPATLGRLAESLHAHRAAWRARYAEAGDRRRALADALAPGAPLDPLSHAEDGSPPTDRDARAKGDLVRLKLASADPDDLTLRQARSLANADRITHRAGIPSAILDRARADAARIECAAPPFGLDGLTVDVEMT